MRVDRLTADYLRRYRDEILAKSALGRLQIAGYRQVSRKLGPVVARNEALRTALAAGFLAVGRFARWRVDRAAYAHLRRPVQRLAVRLALAASERPRS